MGNLRHLIRRGGAAVAALALAGCQTGGTPLERALIEGGAPHPSEVVRDLAENDAAIDTFELPVKFLFFSPELSVKIERGRGRVAYERPAKMYLLISEFRTATPIVRLAVADGRAHVWMKTREGVREEFWRDGDPIEGLPFSIGPTELVQEAFMPEDWAALPPREWGLIDYNEEAAEVTLRIGPEQAPRRRIVVKRVEGPAWVVVRNELLEEDRVVATTTLKDYQRFDGIRFPRAVRAEFPDSNAWIEMEIEKTPTFNEALNEEWFKSLER